MVDKEFVRLLSIVLLSLLTACAGPPRHARREPPVRTLLFADRVWEVRPSTRSAAPGPNAWSDAAEAAWVDEDGLHLRLDRADGAWRSVELSTTLPPEAVHVAATLATPVGQLDPAAVVGLFVYKDDQHEADIEFSRWGHADQALNAQFAVAPYEPDQRHRFRVEPEATRSHHVLDWRGDRVAFQSRVNGAVVAEWRHTAAHWTDRTGYRLHLNLWMYEGRAPDGPSEVVFSDLVVE